MTITKMTRSAYGLETAGKDDPWWHRAACKATPDLFLNNGEDRGDLGRARHICLRHCPVLSDCDKDARRHIPVGIVQAGRRWASTCTGGRTGPSAMQPIDPGHGSWCAVLRVANRHTSTPTTP